MHRASRAHFERKKNAPFARALARANVSPVGVEWAFPKGRIFMHFLNGI